MTELSNNISILLNKHRAILRPILEDVSNVKVDQFPKINDLKNLGYRYENFLDKLEVKSEKNEAFAECFELLKLYKEFLPRVRVNIKQKEAKKTFKKKQKGNENILHGGTEEISGKLIKRFDEGQEGVIRRIYELCKQAKIYPIEFDRLFYLIGSGRYEGLGSLEVQDFKPKSLKQNVYQPFGENRKDIYQNFLGIFKESVEKNFNSHTFEEIKLWVVNHYNESLSEKKLSIADIDSFTTHSYTPGLLEDDFPSENALIDHLIHNRYASGANAKEANVKLTVKALQKYFKLDEDISIDAMKERASLFVQEEEFSFLSLKSEKGNDANLAKDIELLFHAFDFINKKCDGSMEYFYNTISMKELELSENIDSYEDSFVELVKDISNWPNYGFALSANFIKDYQLSRELKNLPKDKWKLKFAAYTAKPDLHLINFTSFISDTNLLNKFLEYKSSL